MSGLGVKELAGSLETGGVWERGHKRPRSRGPGRKAQGLTQQTDAYMQHSLSFHPLEDGGKESAASLDRG